MSRQVNSEGAALQGDSMTVPFFSPLYRRIIAFWDPKVPARLRPLWEHPCGECALTGMGGGTDWRY